MIWIVPATALAALLLMAAGVVVLGTEARSLRSKAETLKPRVSNRHRFRQAIDRLRRDLEAASVLVDRARSALTQIDSAFHDLAALRLARLFRSRGN